MHCHFLRIFSSMYPCKRIYGLPTTTYLALAWCWVFVFWTSKGATTLMDHMKLFDLRDHYHVKYHKNTQSNAAHNEFISIESWWWSSRNHYHALLENERRKGVRVSIRYTLRCTTRSKWFGTKLRIFSWRQGCKQKSTKILPGTYLLRHGVRSTVELFGLFLRLGNQLPDPHCRHQFNAATCHHNNSST
jgi:hypothetical protein